MAEEKDKYESIATKIAAEHKERLEKILESKGMNYYQWFQLMAEITIRMSDDRHNLSPAMSKMIQMFQMIPGWKDPTTLLDPNARPEIQAAIYMMNTKGKKGLKVVMVERDWFDGLWHEIDTENVMDIVERVIEATLPQSYKWLRQRMTDLDCTRVFECLLRLADEASAGTFEQEINEMFGDNDRGDFGQKPTTNKTKRRKYVGVEDMQGLLQFDEMDSRMAIHTQEEMEERERQAREASEWLREHNDFDPHGGEW